MYRVVSSFTDLKDNRYHYKVGDKYPRDGYKPTKERLEYLASDRTKRKSPVIEEIKEEPKAEPKAEEPKKAKRTAKRKQ